MDFRAYLRQELQRRQSRNRRYSLRAYASSLGVPHSTISRLLHRPSRLTASMICRLGTRLGLLPEEVRAAVVWETAESIMKLVGHPRFRPDCRWLAMMSGVPLDDINVGLHYLLHTRRITMSSPHRWNLESI
jgi:hypothetical protein